MKYKHKQHEGVMTHEMLLKNLHSLKWKIS